MKYKRGQTSLMDVPTLLLILLLIGITIALGLVINDKFAEDACEDQGGVWNSTRNGCMEPSTGLNNYSRYSYGLNATLESSEGIDTMSGFQVIWAIVIAAAIVIGIIFSVLAVKRFGK